MLFAQDQVITGKLYSNNETVSIEVNGGIISAITVMDADESKNDSYIGPGLIDTQVNGYISISFGKDDLTTGDVRKVTEAMWKEGVTTYFPTLVSSPNERIKNSLSVLTRALEKDDGIRKSVPGFFLEGPYISPLDGFRGAHTQEYVRKPDWKEFSEFIKISNDQIILVGIAPESEGALPFIQKCKKAGIHISLAHHNGDAKAIHEAVNNGATVSTHLGNGCANMINRHNNPLLLQGLNWLKKDSRQP